MALFIFFCARPKTRFLGKFGQKNQNCQFKLKFGTETNSNMQNSMALFTFSVSDRKHRFWGNLVQKVKIVSLSWNLVLRLIPSSMVVFTFSVYTENTLLGKRR